MRPDLVDITLVVDRSGSMESIQSDAEGGVNAFLAEQANQPGQTVLTLVQFDTEYEFVHRGVPLKRAPRYKLVPRGGTALLDAVGRAINGTGERLAKIPEKDRPGLVIFVVVTDGEENSSKEFSLAKVKEMIEHQQSVYKWQFTFLSADANAFAEAGGMGIAAAGVAQWSRGKARAAYAAASDKVARMRKQVAAMAPVDNRFTEEEIKRMKN
jgi:Mg-chelatase subunit ChlD